MKKEEAAIPLIAKEWSENEELFLRTAFLEFGGNPLQMDRIKDLLSGRMSGLERDIALLGLRKKGWIHAAKKTWGEYIFYIPVQHFVFLTEHYIMPFYKKVPVVSSPGVQVAKEAKPKITGEILHLLSYIAIHGVPLTAKGTIHKKAISKIENLTVLSSIDFVDLRLSYSHPELYPVQVAVLLDLIFTLGLAQRDEAEVKLNESYVSRWIQLQGHHMERYVYEAFMERYSVQNPGLQHFRYLLALFGREDAGGWLDVYEICNTLALHGLVKNEEAAEIRAYAKGWVTMLAAFGYGDTGVHGLAEGLYFRWTSPLTYDTEEADQRQISQPSLYVQPDFEIIVSPEAPYTIRWLLEGCAELAVRDHMTIYKLTRERLNEGAELGISPSFVLEQLNQYSLEQVPENVVRALKQWEGEFSRTSFAQVMLLEVQSEQDADKIEAYPSWNGAIHRIGPLYFILDQQKMTEVRKRLTMMGLPPAKTVKGMDTEERKYPAIRLKRDVTDAPENSPSIRFYEEGRQGFVYTGRNLHYYEPVMEDRDTASIIPSTADVPKMWLDEWRAYHPSTAKQLLQQAINWQTRVGMEKEGERLEFIPESIGRGEPWAVEGWLISEGMVPERRTIVPDERTKLTLKLPKYVKC